VLADDHDLVRELMVQLLGSEPDIEVVGMAADGQEAVELAGRLLPDVIVLDVGMPRLGGVEATQIIHRDFPEIHIIALSMFEEAERKRAMRDAGAVDYITKSAPAREVVKAIRRACPRR
jgi:NarL family two-component system response regulator LiaR